MNPTLLRAAFSFALCCLASCTSSSSGRIQFVAQHEGAVWQGRKAASPAGVLLYALSHNGVPARKVERPPFPFHQAGPADERTFVVYREQAEKRLARVLAAPAFQGDTKANWHRSLAEAKMWAPVAILLAPVTIVDAPFALIRETRDRAKSAPLERRADLSKFKPGCPVTDLAGIFGAPLWQNESWLAFGPAADRGSLAWARVLVRQSGGRAVAAYTDDFYSDDHLTTF